MTDQIPEDLMPDGIDCKLKRSIIRLPDEGALRQYGGYLLIYRKEGIRKRISFEGNLRNMVASVNPA